MAQSGKNCSGSRCDRSSERRRTLISMSESKGTALPAYLEMDHEEVLDALEAVEADVVLGRTIRWNKLISVMQEMKVNRETAPDCLNFAKALLGLFERYHCRDISIMSEVFGLLLSLTQPHYINVTEYIEFEKIFRIPYGEQTTVIDLVWNALRRANLGLLKLQLKFGMGLTLSCSVSAWKKYIKTLVSEWMHNSYGNTSEDESTEEFSIRDLIVRIEEAMEKTFCCDFNTKSIKRLDLVLRVLEMLRVKKVCHPDFTKHLAECYRLLFDSIPEAFVTSVEVKASLEKFLPSSFSRLISRITEDFKNHLPELAEVPQPRSLQHLCRIRVRQSLRRNLSLPHGVSSLPLPTKLKDYIMLNDDGDYSVINKCFCRYDPRSRDYCTRPEWYISTPEGVDCVTSFLKSL